MLIRELARRLELSVDTIRFYEKQGLLDEEHYERTTNGYRHYSEAAVQRLKLIRMGQAAGFTLSEMSGMIAQWESNEISPAEKEAHLWHKIEEVNRKIEQLNTVKAYLLQKIEILQTEQALPEPTLT